MAEKIDETAKSGYLGSQNICQVEENFQLNDLAEIQKFILCCILTIDIVKSSSQLAKEVVKKRGNMDESDENILTSEIIRAKVSLLTILNGLD